MWLKPRPKEAEGACSSSTEVSLPMHVAWDGVETHLRPVVASKTFFLLTQLKEKEMTWKPYTSLAASGKPRLLAEARWSVLAANAIVIYFTELCLSAQFSISL